jgi:MFS family permease
VSSEPGSVNASAASSGKPANRVSFGPAFTIFWLAATVSTLGDGLGQIGFPLLVEGISTNNSNNATLMALIYPAFRVPWIFAAVIGAYVDRQDARRVLLAADAGRAVMLLVVLFAITRNIPIGFVFIAALSVGLGECFAQAAINRVVPRIVSDHQLGAANGRLYATLGASEQVGGYALAGPVSSLGLRAPLFVDAGSFVASALLIWRLPKIPASDFAKTDQRPLLRVLSESFRWARKQPPLVTCMAFVGVMAFTQGLQMAIAPVFVRNSLRLSNNGFGLVFAAMGLGSIVGSAVTNVLWRRFGAARLLSLVGLVVTIGYLLSGVTRNPIVAGFAFFLESAAVSVGVVLNATVRQRLIPEEIRGGVINTIRALSMTLQVAGGLLAALLARFTTPGMVLVIAGIVAGIGVTAVVPSLKSTLVGL